MRRQGRVRQIRVSVRGRGRVRVSGRGRDRGRVRGRAGNRHLEHGGAHVNVYREAKVLDDCAQLLRRDLAALVRSTTQRDERVHCEAARPERVSDHSTDDGPWDVRGVRCGPAAPVSLSSSMPAVLVFCEEITFRNSEKSAERRHGEVRQRHRQRLSHEAHRSLHFHLSRPQRSCQRAPRPSDPGPWLPRRNPQVKHRHINWRERRVAHIAELPLVPTHRWRRCCPCRSGRRLRGTLRSPRWRGTSSLRSRAPACATLCRARAWSRTAENLEGETHGRRELAVGQKHAQANLRG